MSKKIASGADKIIIDIKVGNGALLQSEKDAKKLSELMIKIGEVYNREVRCIISDMNVPLGKCVGNSLEVMEAMDVLQEKEVNNNFVDLCYELATEMVSMGKEISKKEAHELVKNVIRSGDAYKKFLEMVEHQCGDITKIKASKNTIELKSPKSGVVESINALELGKLSLALGAGKVNKNDKINYTVGIKLEKLVGEKVKKGDLLATLYVDKKVPEVNLDLIYTIR
jgi:pyrimidine-nucleoside phosphorylase